MRWGYGRWAELTSFNKAHRSPLYCSEGGKTAAFIKKHKNLTFYWIMDAGHMVNCIWTLKPIRPLFLCSLIFSFWSHDVCYLYIFLSQAYERVLVSKAKFVLQVAGCALVTLNTLLGLSIHAHYMLIRTC